MRKAIKLSPIILVGVAAIFAARSRMRHTGPLEVGEAALEFTLPTLARNPVALRDYRRQVVVLNFWATWCPPCVEETPSLEKFSSAMQRLHVSVIGVSVDQDPAALEKFVRDYHLSFPIARDPDQSLAALYGTFKFPETYILDRNGRVAEKLIGAVDWQDPRLVSFVRALAGSPETAAP